MDDRVPVTIEMDAADHATLNDIARQSDRSFAEVAASALIIGIAEQANWQDAIREGLADEAAGHTISNAQYKAEAVERRRRWLAQRHR